MSAQGDEITSEYQGILYAIHNVLLSQRTAMGYTQADLAKALGKTQPTINKAEKPAPNVSLRILFEYAKALDMSLSELFHHAERRAGYANTKSTANNCQPLAHDGFTNLQIEQIRISCETQLNKALGAILAELAKTASS